MFALVGANWDDVGVNELHDCFVANEVQYVSCCPHEKRHANLLAYSSFVELGDNRRVRVSTQEPRNGPPGSDECVRDWMMDDGNVEAMT